MTDPHRRSEPHIVHRMSWEEFQHWDVIHFQLERNDELEIRVLIFHELVTSQQQRCIQMGLADPLF